MRIFLVKYFEAQDPARSRSQGRLPHCFSDGKCRTLQVMMRAEKLVLHCFYAAEYICAAFHSTGEALCI